jgi:type III secretion protein Q
MSAPNAVQPFPWRSLGTVGRGSLSALRTARHVLARHVRLEAIAEAVGALVGTEVRAVVRRAWTGPMGTPLEGGVGITLRGADDDGPGAIALIEAESALAAAIVGLALKRPAVIAKLDAPVSPPLAGAFAAVLVAAARRAHGDVPLRVVAVGPAEVLEPSFVRATPDALAIGLTVLVGDEAFVARCLVAPTFASAGGDGWNATVLAGLGAVPLVLPVVACATLARACDVAALRVGDVWLPGGWNAGLAGPFWLAGPSAAVGLRARLAPPNRLVLSGEVNALAAPEATMSESGDSDAVVEALGDVPVVVRVEVGEATMPAREWASIRKGDVVTLGKRVGELVLLRVGGVPIARGELVSVDGEVGVRVVERMAGDVTTK